MSDLPETKPMLPVLAAVAASSPTMKRLPSIITATNALPGAQPLKKKKTSRACIFCQRSHMPCDPGRPCERCIKRGLSKECRDGTRKKSKYMEDQEAQAKAPVVHNITSQAPINTLRTTSTSGVNLSSSSSGGTATTTLASLPAPHNLAFVSDALNREFTVLGDIVTAPIDDDESEYARNIPPEMGISSNSNFNLPAELSPDFVYDRVTEPYSYAQGFHHLLSFSKQRMEKDDMLRICKSLVRFRPSFMSTVKNLSRQDLIFMEKCFQRTVLEFNKLLSYIGTPTCVWRRTGELALVGKEFSLLTQWNVEDLLGKSTFIYELMDNRSTVDYWEKYASVVLDNSQQSVITKCTLIRPDRAIIPCTVCYTIKRDIFDVPLCVIGNFLPILNSNYRI